MNNVPIIAIDLGTANSLVGTFQNGKFEIIPNDLGKNITPSFVAFTETEILVGEKAKNQMHRNPKNTIFGINRLIGRKFEEKKVQEQMKFCPFKIIKDEESLRPKIQVTYKNQQKQYLVEYILAIILRKLKQYATNFLGKEPKDAIIVVPTYFNRLQKEEVKDAALLSGLNILDFINSSIAAAFYYAFDKNIIDEKKMFIF